MCTLGVLEFLQTYVANCVKTHKDLIQVIRQHCKSKSIKADMGDMIDMADTIDMIELQHESKDGVNL